MKPLIQFKKTTPTLFIPLAVICFGLAPMAQAVGPDTEGSITGSNNGEGVGVLVSRTSGVWNTGTGFEALNHLTSGNQNTATGLRSLFSDSSGGYNTATGVYSLYTNTTGFFNSATGAYSLAKNTTGTSNTANGYSALNHNTTGFDNTAFGFAALYQNTTGFFNTAIGDDALFNCNGNSHVAVGVFAGDGITTVDNNIIIGHHTGVHSVFGQVSDRCFIDNIYGAPVSAGTAAFVFVDSDGRLGTTTVDGPDPGGFSSQPAQPYVPQGAKQAMLNLKVEKLQATVTQQQKQIEILTAQLKEQAAQIQKVSAQLEVSKPATKMVVNKP